MARSWAFFIALCALFLAGCRYGVTAPTVVPTPDITGVWLATQDVALDLYEFYADGTGRIRTSDGDAADHTPFTFAYEFVAADTLTFTVADNPPTSVAIDLQPPDQLLFQPQEVVGVSLIFTRIGPCAQETLGGCITGRWVRYWPDGSWTLYDFYPDNTGVAFVPEVAQSTHFTYTSSGTHSLTLQLDQSEPVNLTAVQPDNFTLHLIGTETNDSFSLYRLNLP